MENIPTPLGKQELTNFQSEEKSIFLNFEQVQDTINSLKNIINYNTTFDVFDGFWGWIH